jgi:hypothetical protein
MPRTLDFVMADVLGVQDARIHDIRDSSKNPTDRVQLVDAMHRLVTIEVERQQTGADSWKVGQASSNTALQTQKFLESEPQNEPLSSAPMGPQSR